MRSLRTNNSYLVIALAFVLAVASSSLLNAQIEEDSNRSLGDAARALRAQKQPAPATSGAEANTIPPSPPSLAVVTESPEVGELATSVRLLVFHSDFEGLDKLAERLRKNKERFPGGSWKLTRFYATLGEIPAGSSATDADWQAQLDFFQKWIKARPDSITARVALADSYLDYAWVARGNGYSDSVTEEGWKLFGERTEQGIKTLIEASSLTTKCPQWYSVMQNAALAEGADKSQLRTIFEKAVAFEPDYYAYYQNFAHDLLPQWQGQPGELEAFAQESYRRIGGSNGAYIYFEIAGSLCGECGQFVPELFSWPEIQEGFHTLERSYGVDPLKLNRFAYFAVRYGDKATAAAAFRGSATPGTIVSGAPARSSMRTENGPGWQSRLSSPTISGYRFRCCNSQVDFLSLRTRPPKRAAGMTQSRTF